MVKVNVSYLPFFYIYIFIEEQDEAQEELDVSIKNKENDNNQTRTNRVYFILFLLFRRKKNSHFVYSMCIPFPTRYPLHILLPLFLFLYTKNRIDYLVQSTLFLSQSRTLPSSLVFFFIIPYIFLPLSIFYLLILFYSI